MNIKVSGFKSILNYEGEINNITGDYLKTIEAALGEKIAYSELEDYDCDLKLIYIESGGSEGFFLKNIDKLRAPYYLLTNGSNNSLAASLEIMTYINLHDKSGEVIHGDIPYVVERIKVLALTNKVRSALANSKLGVMGTPSNWLIASVPSYSVAHDKLGVNFEDISLDEVKEEYYKGRVCDVSKLPAEFDRDEKLKALQVYNAFKAVAGNHGLDGFTVRCFDLLGPLKTTGCVGLALLNDAGITATCEGDIAAMISMHIARIVSGESTFQANPSRISTDDNTIVFAHCTLPIGMTAGYKLDTHFESGTGVSVKGYLREEDVTVLRISSDLKRFFVSDARIVKNLEEKDLCRTQILVKMNKDVREILTNPCGNHHIIFYGHYERVLTDVLKNLLG